MGRAHEGGVMLSAGGWLGQGWRSDGFFFPLGSTYPHWKTCQAALEKDEWDQVSDSWPELGFQLGAPAHFKVHMKCHIRITAQVGFTAEETP